MWLDLGGSAPLVWGTSSKSPCAGQSNRFSPTGVGNVPRSEHLPSKNEVQPHWCGERQRLLHCPPCVHGSAPLVWGTFVYFVFHCQARRFSPTGVGNVRPPLGVASMVSVQPHWCGERHAVGVINIAVVGSAPLVWGTCALCVACALRLRFSPTGVGNVAVFRE